MQEPSRGLAGVVGQIRQDREQIYGEKILIAFTLLVENVDKFHEQLAC